MKKVLFAMVAVVLVASVPAFAHCGKCGVDAEKVHSMKASLGDIVTIASTAGDFNTLVLAIKAAGLVATLQSAGPFTVFAPTDEAFDKLPKGTVESLLANPDQLKKILLYHVVPGKVAASDVVNLSSATTAEGSNVAINVKDGKVMVNDAQVIKTDVMASNGVIHVIDTVILPSS